MSGALAIFRKEWREMYWRGRPTGNFWLGLFMAVVFAALALASATVGMGIAPGVAVVTAISLAAFAGVVAPLPSAGDLVAGERERHTLATMLCLPVRDHEVVLGKAGAQVAFAGVVSALSVSLAVIGLVVLHGAVVLPWLLLGPAAVVGATVGATVLVCLAVFVTARAETVKAGQQRLVFVPLLFFVPVLLLPRAAEPSPWLLVVPLVALLVVPAAIAGAFLAFRRHRLLP